MATSIYAGGARRGPAPSYSPRMALTTQAGISDEELMNQLVASFQQGSTAMPVAAGAAAAPSFNLPSVDFGTAGDSPSTVSPMSAGGGLSASQVQGAGQLMGVVGNLAQDPTLSQVGSVVSLGGMLAGSKSAEDLALNAALAGASLAGVPGVGLMGSVARGSVPGMVNSLVGLVSPQAAMANTISGLLGFGTLGSAVNNFNAAPAGSFGELGLSGTISLGEAINMNEAVQNAQQPAVDLQTAALLDALAAAGNVGYSDADAADAAASATSMGDALAADMAAAAEAAAGNTSNDTTSSDTSSSDSGGWGASDVW